VIRVESHARLDVARLGPPWHDASPAWSGASSTPAYNTSKYGLALDLARPEAPRDRAPARRVGDVVVESFTPRVMRGWGLACDDLRQLNPGLVMMSTCLQGTDRPACRVSPATAS
jgi:crotonobetainyl-CoA:carnitine CoA-transferase CaiB-like acyl-CoA transferase